MGTKRLNSWKNQSRESHKWWCFREKAFFYILLNIANLVNWASDHLGFSCEDIRRWRAIQISPKAVCVTLLMSFLLSLKSSYTKNKISWKCFKNNDPFQHPVYWRVCFGYLAWLCVTAICCVWVGAGQTGRDVWVPLKAIKACEIGQLARQTALRSISSTFGSWLRPESGAGSNKVPLYVYWSFGEKRENKKALNVGCGSMNFQILLSLYPFRSIFPGMPHTTPYNT